MDDLISRESMIGELRQMYNAARKWYDDAPQNSETEVRAESRMAALIEMKWRVETMPSAQKTGTWIDHQNGKWVYAQCNICGTIWDTKSNYCPNCGAKMEASDHGND